MVGKNELYLIHILNCIMAESILQTNKNTLICIREQLKSEQVHDADYIIANFCGNVITSFDSDFELYEHVYVCGNIVENLNKFKFEKTRAYYIRELSDCDSEDFRAIGLGSVPINIYGLGVYFRQVFTEDYFTALCREHAFQVLTESNKPSVSLRKGLYITDVEDCSDGTHFRLLRCSTNLDGPTDNFRETDHTIVNTVNGIANEFFHGAAPLNHVLGQVYENITSGTSEKKATIGIHSDKTKDMPSNGLMAFTTFYKFTNTDKLHSSEEDTFDVCYKGTSVLTKLCFKLKSSVVDSRRPKEFALTLYPGSVFIMPLSTNRLYTHTVKASSLPIDKIPTRLGYVIRSSKTEAVHKDGQTYIYDADGALTPLLPITHEDHVHIKTLYHLENTTTDVIDYGIVTCSMNRGDYIQPIK